MKRPMNLIVFVWLAFMVTAALAPARVEAAACGDLLIILDRSGSMAACSVGGMTKEAIAKKSINAVVDMFPTVGVGLAVFPDTDTATPTECAMDRTVACRKGKVVIDVAADGGPKVKSYLAAMATSCGGTPTGDTLLTLQDYAKFIDGKEHFVLIITDGQPTCQDGEDGYTFNETTQTCVPAGICNGKGTCQCRNPKKVYDAITHLANRGIHTFVVGFEGAGSGQGCGENNMPFDPNVLNKMAELGLEPQGAPAATRYYSATNEASLLDSLKKILGKVGGGTMGGCIKNTDAGAGGGGSDGGGAGGGGAGGAGAGAGGQGGGDNSGEDPPGRERPASSCSCTTAAGSSSSSWGGAGAFALLALAAARARRARRWPDAARGNIAS